MSRLRDDGMPGKIWVWYDNTTARQWDPNPVADADEYVPADTVKALEEENKLLRDVIHYGQCFAEIMSEGTIDKLLPEIGLGNVAELKRHRNHFLWALKRLEALDDH